MPTSVLHRAHAPGELCLMLALSRTMINLELDDEGFLITRAFENGPSARTWRKCLEDIDELGPNSGSDRIDELLELYGLEDEEELGNEVPFEKLCELITWETPAGAAFSLLSPFESDARTSGVIEFYESPSIGSDFVGVKLIGTRLEFRRLLRELGLSDAAFLPLECEIYATQVSSKAARTALTGIDHEENDEKIDFIEAVPLIEDYIHDGEPEIHKYSAMKYDSALSEIPKDSKLYQLIAAEINATGD